MRSLQQYRQHVGKYYPCWLLSCPLIKFAIQIVICQWAKKSLIHFLQAYLCIICDYVAMIEQIVCVGKRSIELAPSKQIITFCPKENQCIYNGYKQWDFWWKQINFVKFSEFFSCVKFVDNLILLESHRSLVKSVCKIHHLTGQKLIFIQGKVLWSGNNNPFALIENATSDYSDYFGVGGLWLQTIYWTDLTEIKPEREGDFMIMALWSLAYVVLLGRIWHFQIVYQ